MMRVCGRTGKCGLATEEAAKKADSVSFFSEAQNLPWRKAKKKQVPRANTALGMTIL